MTPWAALDVRAPPLAPRTRLYHLAPLGVGTAQVESLSGYVARLAEEHGVPTGTLVAGELLPQMRLPGLGARATATWWLEAGPRFNGTGAITCAALDALAGLTGRQDLASLTLRPWADVLAPYGLLRLGKQARVWCEACYAEALEQGTPLYEPLLWSMALVVVCPRHRRRLSGRCPHDDCARVLPVIAARTRPGHCSRCLRLLLRPGWASLATQETGWDLWVAQQIGALLATTSTLARQPTLAASLGALEALLRSHCGNEPGAAGRFAQAVGLHINRLCQWRKGRFLPTIHLLLRVCSALGIALSALLTGDLSELNTAVQPPTVPAPQRKARRAPVAYDAHRLRQQLDALLSSSAPLSVAETARRLGCPPAVLVRLFPDTCRLVVTRYQADQARQRDERVQHLAADIRQVMAEFDRADIYPASKRVRARLQRRVHPRNSDYNRIRQQLLKEFGWNKDGTRIVQD